MKKAFEEILSRLEDLKLPFPDKCYGGNTNDLIEETRKVVQKVAEEYNNGWILCSERMPPVETEVLILTKIQYKDGGHKYITTAAMYEDGTVLENESCWYWENIDGAWDEENDCYIIPEAWWECRHYNPADVYNNTVDDEVIAWQPLPEPYKEREQNE